MTWPEAFAVVGVAFAFAAIAWALAWSADRPAPSCNSHKLTEPETWHCDYPPAKSTGKATTANGGE